MAKRAGGGEGRTGELRAPRPAALPAWRPFQSLPSRIIASVFAAALVTSALVTWVSTQSTEVFLRSKINDRFPTRLDQVAGELHDWYEQRRIDIETFARSDSLTRGLTGPPHAREEARTYLGYVHEEFPQYRSLLVLDPAGRPGVQVGEAVDLADEEIARLAAIREPRVSGARRLRDEWVQVISAPVRAGEQVIGTLHAVVGLRAIEPLLAGGDGLEATTRLYVVGPDSEVLVAPRGPAPGSRYERALPAEVSAARVEDTVDAAGQRVVAGARGLALLGWTLVLEESYDVAFAPVVSVIRKILAINFAIVAVFGVIAFLIARSIARPIHALSEGARRIAEGETDVRIPQGDGRGEIGVLSRALNEMVARLTAANEELLRSNEMLEQLSFTDGLTRLHNHRFFQDRLQMETKRSDRSGEPLALLLLDIDDFKLLNDRFGHAVGDEVLRQVAAVLNETVRETDVPARYGGEEFAVIAPGSDAEGALCLAERLREGVSRKGRLGNPALEFDLTVSIGVSIYAGDPRAFFNDADRALYRAKDSGKDCVVFAGESSEA
jgi:diguanylate cyclase (GGDEF)-like protein